MVAEYKYNRKNALEVIYKSRGFYIQYLIFSSIIFYFLKDVNFILVFLCVLSIPLFIQLFVHLNYYFKDKNSILTIDYGNKKIELKNKSNFTSILFEDINVIIYSKGSRYEDVSFNYTIPSNLYNYTIIKSKKNEKIVFSDFILANFNLFPVKKKIVIHPFLNIF